MLYGIRTKVMDTAPMLGDTLSMSQCPSGKLSDQIRLAIDECGLSGYRISVETGIDASALSKFRRGERRGLSMASLDRLGDYLGLTITARKRKGR